MSGQIGDGKVADLTQDEAATSVWKTDEAGRVAPSKTPYDTLMRELRSASPAEVLRMLEQMLSVNAETHAADPGKRGGVTGSLNTLAAFVTARFGGELAAPVMQLISGLRDLDKGAVIPLLRPIDTLANRAADTDARSDAKVIAVAVARLYKSLHADKSFTNDKAYEVVAGWLGEMGFRPPSEHADKRYTGKSIKGWYTDIGKDTVLKARLEAHSKTLADADEGQLRAALEQFIRRV